MQADLVVAEDYRRDMIGELMETSRGWALQAPAECINGHPLGPGRVLARPVLSLRTRGRACYFPVDARPRGPNETLKKVEGRLRVLA